ncbi:MAG: GNAT family N-acetyltransferase [Caulobacterales bacterium]|nr:GNAT family N-acetyltransferase [Caulobacterales bacterium]
MTVGPTLETARLILRPPILDDLEAWTAFSADEEVTRFVGGLQSRSQTWRILNTMIGSWVSEGFAMWSVIEKDTGRWIGRMGPWRPADWPTAEVGWGLAREAQGKGYATEAAVAAVDFAFDSLGWAQVDHCIHPDNKASAAVAARLGAKPYRSGRVMPEPYKEMVIDIWGQGRADWARNRRALIA